MQTPQQLNVIPYQLKANIKIHNDPVLTFIILKDSRYASSSCDKSIKIFNPITYKIDIIILEHKDYVAYIYQLKDERLVSSSSDNTIKIFKIFKNSYNVEQIIKGHSKPVKKTIELINGSLVSCSWDKTIKIWNKNKKNTYIESQKLEGNMEVDSVFEINDKEFFSISVNETSEEINMALSFYKIKNGKFENIKIIDKMNICSFSSNSVKINEKYFLVGGEKKIYFIDLITYSINKIYELDKNVFAQSLYLLNDGNLIVGAACDLLIFKIKDNNLELIMDLKIIKNENEDEDEVMSSIKEDLNKNIIISFYNGKIKVLSKK